jgi:hypothetical protein
LQSNSFCTALSREFAGDAADGKDAHGLVIARSAKRDAATQALKVKSTLVAEWMISGLPRSTSFRSQ